MIGIESDFVLVTTTRGSQEALRHVDGFVGFRCSTTSANSYCVTRNDTVVLRPSYAEDIFAIKSLLQRR